MAYLLPQIIMFGLLGALLGRAGIHFQQGEWWAWFIPMLVLLYVRDAFKKD